MEQKYILTDETVVVDGHTLSRIKAVRDFGNVRKGDLGGFVQTENNLSHKDTAWIYNNAAVYDDAVVGDSAAIYGDARVRDNAAVFGHAEVYGDADVHGNAEVCADANVYGNARVYDNARVHGDANVYGNARVYGDADVHGNAVVYDNAEVCGDAEVCGEANVGGNAEVSSMADYIVFKNWWSSGRYFTWTRSNDKWRVGCFYGSGKRLVARAYKDSEESGREYQRIVEYVESVKSC